MEFPTGKSDGIIDFMNTREPEKCYYCDNKAEFNDLAFEGTNFIVTGVCSKHIKNYGQA